MCIHTFTIINTSLVELCLGGQLIFLQNIFVDLQEKRKLLYRLIDIIEVTKK